MTICSSHGIKTQEIKGKLFITFFSTLTPELQAQFMDLIVEYMEESINWPDPDDQETFEKQLLG